MKILSTLKSKKGMAIEHAIVFLIVIFTFCALLTSLTMYGHYRTKLDSTVLLNRVTAESIGEDFLAGATQDELTAKYENYACTVSDNILTVKRGESVVLYVEKDGSGNLLCWRYSLPETE